MRPSEYLPTLKSEALKKTFWRDVVIEFFATFFLMASQAALPLDWGNPTLGSAVQVGLGMGFVVTCMAWTLGDFSGGHMNPAVSLAMVFRLEITVLRALFYIIAQCCGAMAGAGFVYGITPSDHRGNLAATTLGDQVKPWQGMLTEAWITCMLVITILGSTNMRRKGNVYMATIPIGLSIALGIMSAFASTGASMNPARTLGPAVVMGIWDDHWVYWVGPFIGAGVAVLLYSLADLVDINDVDKTNTIKSSQDEDMSGGVKGTYLTTFDNNNQVA